MNSYISMNPAFVRIGKSLNRSEEVRDYFAARAARARSTIISEAPLSPAILS